MNALFALSPAIGHRGRAGSLCALGHVHGTNLSEAIILFPESESSAHAREGKVPPINTMP
jgi:hypothetical protein